MASTTGAAIRMLVSGLRYGARPGWIAIAILSVGVTDGASAQAQTAIKTDASWGRTAQTLAPGASATSFLASSGATLSVPGNLYTIPQTLGQKAGANLFHSFESFRVGTGDAALFTTTESFNNVISRVSGSSATTINGILALQPAAGSKPNFFFINPNGIAFGAGAQVDVPAAFHVSTANELRFTGNTVFRAGAGADSSLTVAPPVAFGFLGTTRAPVLVTDGTLLQTARGAGISVIGGDVEINNGVLFAPGGGDVRVAAVGAGAAEIALTGPLPVLHGTLNVVNGGVIVTASSGARDSGSIAVSGGEVTVDGQGSGATFTGISSVAAPGGTGNAGNVTVTAAGRLSVVDGAISSSDSFSLARTGSVSASPQIVSQWRALISAIFLPEVMPRS